MCEVHEGEVKVLWKGARSAAGEARDREGCPYCCGKGRRYKNVDFTSSAASQIQLAKVCYSRR